MTTKRQSTKRHLEKGRKKGLKNGPMKCELWGAHEHEISELMHAWHSLKFKHTTMRCKELNSKIWNKKIVHTLRGNLRSRSSRRYVPNQLTWYQVISNPLLVDEWLVNRGWSEACNHHIKCLVRLTYYRILWVNLALQCNTKSLECMLGTSDC